MSASFYTWTNAISADAHAVLEDGVGIVIGADSNHAAFTTAAPTAGGKVDYIAKDKAPAAGDVVGLAVVNIGDIVQLRADAAVVYGANVMVQANGRFITATATNTTQYKAIQAASQGSVFSAVRIEAETVA